MLPRIPKILQDKASEMLEISYGATRVVLILKDGNKIEDVILAWGAEIVRIGDKKIAQDSDLEFSTQNIMDILSA